MRAFDWLALLQRRRIHYIERGANVKRGEINIQCPWCGTADPSQHLGLNLETGWYACWRNKQGHSGKSPLRLLMKLLNVSYGEARELAGLGDDYVDPEGFTALVAKLMGREVAGHAMPPVRSLVYPREFRDIGHGADADRWVDYLWNRGFDGRDLDELCRKYELMAARSGDYGGRLIIPYFLGHKLIAWTGRAIAPAKIRYKDLDVKSSIVEIKDTLYNYDKAASEGRKKALVVVEGPLDALKLDYYGADYGVRAVGLSTNSISDAQLYQLEDLALGYPQLIVMLDNKTDFGLIDGMRFKQQLAHIPRVKVEATPFSRPDPGDLAPGEVRSWCQNIMGVKT